jgi:DNA-directed RNA polymerase subunit RPC12/RpoP
MDNGELDYISHHENYTDGKLKGYKCHRCSYGFSNTAIHNHLYPAIVEDDGKFFCVRCKAEWSGMLGDNERPFICPYCEEELNEKREARREA